MNPECFYCCWLPGTIILVCSLCSVVVQKNKGRRLLEAQSTSITCFRFPATFPLPLTASVGMRQLVWPPTNTTRSKTDSVMCSLCAKIVMNAFLCGNQNLFAITRYGQIEMESLPHLSPCIVSMSSFLGTEFQEEHQQLSLGSNTGWLSYLFGQ